MPPTLFGAWELPRAPVRELKLSGGDETCDRGGTEAVPLPVH